MKPGKMSDVQELDEFEDKLIAQLRDHPVLAGVSRLPADEFATVLLERRFVSLAFTPTYDLVIDLLQDEAARRIARVILREEYPDSRGRTPSHREDMTEDMRRLGIDQATIVASRPSAATKQVIADTFDLIAEAGGEDDADLRLLTILRFWGEVLVSVEYGRFWERMAPVLTARGSRFYHPHHVHDAKAQPLATLSQATTHSDRLAARLVELLTDAPSIDSFKLMEERSLELKLRFYSQFA